jgi:Zn-finger nucleic acid-binding protein
MDCPVCYKPMIAMELDEVELDHCLGCGGVWLDAGELQLLLGDLANASALLDSFHSEPSAEKSRKCPICRKRMEQVHLSCEKEPILIDRCRRRHGLWFDKGELPRIVAANSFDPQHKVEKLLADMFGDARQGDKP